MTPFKLCPACEGEGKVETGYDYCDRETGAWSPVLAECTMCEGKGGVPDDGQDEPNAPSPTAILPASILLAAGLSYQGIDEHGTIHMSLAAPVKRVL